MEAVTWITENWGIILSAIVSLLVVAGLLAKLTKTPKDDAIVAKLQAFVALLPKAIGKGKKK